MFSDYTQDASFPCKFLYTFLQIPLLETLTAEAEDPTEAIILFTF